MRAQDRPPTLGALLERYQADVLPKENLSARRNKRTHCAFWAAQLGSVPLDTLTAHQIAQARSLSVHSRSPSTANRYLLKLVCRRGGIPEGTKPPTGNCVRHYKRMASQHIKMAPPQWR